MWRPNKSQRHLPHLREREADLLSRLLRQNGLSAKLEVDTRDWDRSACIRVRSSETPADISDNSVFRFAISDD
jgi:hypothetical protein